MRKLLTILFICFFLVNGVSQTTYPTNQWFGSANTLTEFKGAGKAAHGFINGVYADTSLANLAGYLRFYPGAQIMAGDSMYFRDKTAVRWLLMNGSGGGGGGTFVGLTDGPGAFAGQAGKSVRVNVGETALEYFTPGGSATWGAITGTLSNQTDLQTAFNLKANLASPTFTGTVVIPSPFTLGATSVLTSGAELNFVDGVTSNIQTQLDLKAPLISPLFTTPRLAATSTINYVWTATDGSGNGSWQVLPSDNLIVVTAGAGEPTWYTSGDTLYLKSINGATTDADSSLTISGGSSLFPTTGTGTATGAVVGSLDGNTLTVNQGANEFFHIDPTAGDEHAHIQAYNTTAGDNISAFTANTNNTSAIIVLSASFNAGVKAAEIAFLANTTTSTLEYTSDTHSFTGTVTFAGLAGNGAGFAAIDNNGTISWSAGSGGGGTFVGLTDGPGTFTGQAGKSVRVNVGETALEYFTASGTGDVIKVGTPVNNQLGIWTGDGTIEGDANLTFASSTLNIGVAGAATGILTLSGVTSGTVTIQAASAAGTYTLTLPTTDGGANEFLQTNGSGVLTWAAGGGTPALTQYRLAVGDASNLLSTGAAITGDRALISDANGVPTHSATTATELGHVSGVTAPIQTQIDRGFTLTLGGTNANPVDASTLHFTTFPAAWHATNTIYQFAIPYTCTLVAVNIEMQCATAGTAEDWIIYVRNNTTATDYAIATVSISNIRRTWNNIAINVPFTAGDMFVMKSVQPTWATNPATCTPTGYAIFR